MLADELKQEFMNDYQQWKAKHHDGLVIATRSQFKQFGHAEALCHGFIRETEFGKGWDTCKSEERVFLEQWIREQGFYLFHVSNSHGAPSVAWKLK